ncbi:MAG: DNA-binding domain-containing protein, partial [Oscillospiraceae bacterium]
MVDGLTVKEVARLKGCTEQYIRKLISNGKINVEKSDNPLNHRLEYIIPIETLPDDLRKKYYRSIAADGPPMPAIQAPEAKQKYNRKTVLEDKPFEAYTQAEREEIMTWCEILEIWQQKRSLFASKTEGDKHAVGYLQCEYPDKQLSIDILYRKYAYYKDNKLGGLLDGRGGWNRGKSTVPKLFWDQFLFYYLDDRQPTVSVCYQSVVMVAKIFFPELVLGMPSEQSFRRKIKKEIPDTVIRYMRKGEKDCFDACAPFIERLYDEIEANDVWIADNHTWDIMVKREDGSEAIHRMYLTAFLDAKSGVLTGWNVTDNPCSDSTIFALRHGIMRHGIPKVCYFDNGTEFLTMDIAGRGNRTRKSQRDVPKPETILSKLGIEMKNAIVRNAKAKPIERTFYTLKEHISKLMSSYCGGTPAERPESLKRQIKNGNIPTDSAFRKDIDTLIEGQYNQEDYGGTECYYKGMTRLEVWNESIQNTVQRVAAAEDLNLMLMRTGRYQKVKKNGISIDIAGEKLWYSNEDTWRYVGKEVY